MSPPVPYSMISQPTLSSYRPSTRTVPGRATRLQRKRPISPLLAPAGNVQAMTCKDNSCNCGIAATYETPRSRIDEPSLRNRGIRHIFPKICTSNLEAKSYRADAGSGDGAENAAILFSVTVSCKLAGADPFAYLQDVLMRIHTPPSDHIHKLIPREWQKRFGAHIHPQTQPSAA